MQNASIQATGEAMPAVTRRSFLRTTAGAAGVTAGLVVPTAMASTVAGRVDAELLALGKNFDRVFADYKVAQTRANKFSDDFHAKHGQWPRKNDPHYDAYMAAYSRDVDPAVITSDELVSVLDQLSSRIRAIPATSLAGVAVKARTLRHDLCKWGDDHSPMKDWDWDDFCLETFIREMQAIGGGLA